MNEKSRLGIFLFFDDEGYVDKYIEYLLDDITKNLQSLVIVCNGILSDYGREILGKYSDNIIVRPNKGFDAGGFREVIIDHLGFDKILSFDELVLFNDSFFGPLYPFKEVFDTMDSRDELDYWGLSSHGETPNVYGMCPYGYRPRYIQTYFLAFRKTLISSEAFQNYWLNMPEFKTFEEAAEKFGCYFTKLFEDDGFKWDVYSNTFDIESDDVTKNMSHHTFNLYEMVAHRKFPIIKRKTCITSKANTLRYNWGGDLAKTFKYVKEHTSYDISLIYKYLLRKYNLDDLKKSLNLNTVISNVDIYNGNELYKDKKVAIIAHTYYPELFDYDLSFLKNAPQNVDIIVTNSDDKKIKILEEKFRPILNSRLNIVKVDSRGRDLSALLVGCRDYLMKYDYICFLHDKKSAQKEYYTVGSSFCDLLWENTLYSEGYIRNVLNRFEENPCLGLLVPPNVYHGTYFSSSKNYWTLCFDKTYEIAKSIGVDVLLDKSKDPFSVGSVFWCKTDALKTIFVNDFKYSDFPGEPLPMDGSLSHALERIFPYVAQYNGYYTEHMLNPDYASAEITNYRTMHTDTLKALHQMPYVYFRTHLDFERTCRKSVVEFVKLRKLYSAQQKSLQTSEKDKHTPVPVQIEPIVITQEIGLKAAFLSYVDKKFPKFFAKIIHKILKY